MKLLYAFLFLIQIIYSKVISIRSGGLKGFYMFGISKYLKENYKLDHCIFYGASAGAWNSLYLCLKNHDDLTDYLTKVDLSSCQNMHDIEVCVKDYFMTRYYSGDFNLHNLNICVSVLNRYRINKKIIEGFVSLHDALDCCMASSHIPYITKLEPIYMYKQYICIDGGFFQDPHPSHVKPDLIIYPEMFDNKNIDKFSNMKNLNIKELIKEGYQDAKKHKRFLDEKLI